ncbi:MAG: competence protein CoiA family protein [Immundisolibacteraceae bacterium]|nr:competence protein CoiA family protein [Immundisolibacteraceae bacterium]
MSSFEDSENNLRAAEEVGCFGLVGGAAKNIRTNKTHYAINSSRSDGPFYCGSCFSDAVLKKCSEKRDHFAHKTPLTPVLPKGESELHQKCKEVICDHLSGIFPHGNWATERPIEKNKLKKLTALRPDISGRIEEKPLAIEIQASSLTIPEIIKRTKSYSRRKIAILWVVPLSEELKKTPFRPRLYERYFHSIYYGRAYYWWPALGEKLVPVHYGVSKRHIDLSSWYDESGSYQEAGGYDKPYKVIKAPECGAKLNIETGFKFHSRDEFTPDNERKSVPACITWQDTLTQWWA